MLPKLLMQHATRVTIAPEAFNKVRDLIEKTARGGPEYCGNMQVHYHPYLGYIVHGFVKDQETEHSAECVPRIGKGQGLWHTHPSGLCGASSIDHSTMLGESKLAIRGVTPGIPPLNLIMTQREGAVCVKAYLPTWSVEYHILENHPYVIESIRPVLDGNYFNNPIYDYYSITVEEKVDKLTGKTYFSIHVLGELDADEVKSSENYGVYVGAHVPPHGLMVLLAFMSQFRREFWLYHELYGLMKVRVDSTKPTVLDVPVSIEPVGLGREERLARLEKEHGYPLSKIRDKTVALYGVGFLGSRIAELLAGYVGRILVVDVDSIGPENLGYQSLYTVEDLDKFKANIVAHELLKRHLDIRIIPARSLVPTPKHGLTQLLDNIVSRSDLVITSFDSLEPRLTVQLAAAKHGKPLIDVATGVSDGEIRIWYPSSRLACLGCYIAQKPSETLGRSVYASKPHFAAILAGLAVQEALNILMGEKPSYNWIKVVLNKNDLAIERRAVEEDPSCPYHRGKCELALSLPEVTQVENTIRVRIEPWSTVSQLLIGLSKLIGKPLKIVVQRRGENMQIGETSIAWLCQLQRLGYKLQLYTANR